MDFPPFYMERTFSVSPQGNYVVELMGLQKHKLEYIFKVGCLYLGKYCVLFYRCDEGIKNTQPVLKVLSGCCSVFKMVFYLMHLQNNEIGREKVLCASSYRFRKGRDCFQWDL